jgi:hypothetical protein
VSGAAYFWRSSLLVIACCAASIAEVSEADHVHFEVRECERSAQEAPGSDRSVCLIGTTEGQNVEILRLEASDDFHGRTTLATRGASESTYLIALEDEPAESYLSYKLIVLQKTGDGFLPLLLMNSWDAPYFADANQDGTQDLVVTHNPFELSSQAGAKGVPLLFDGQNLSSVISIREAESFAQAYLRDLKKSDADLQKQCRLEQELSEPRSSCVDSRRLRRQIAHISSLLDSK